MQNFGRKNEKMFSTIISDNHPLLAEPNSRKAPKSGRALKSGTPNRTSGRGRGRGGRRGGGRGGGGQPALPAAAEEQALPFPGLLPALLAASVAAKRRSGDFQNENVDKFHFSPEASEAAKPEACQDMETLAGSEFSQSQTNSNSPFVRHISLTNHVSYTYLRIIL